MKTHEYQAKQILRISGVKVPRGILATSPLEAEDAARQLGSDVLVVKAQIHAGGRGKAGGVKIAADVRPGRKQPALPQCQVVQHLREQLSHRTMLA